MTGYWSMEDFTNRKNPAKRTKSSQLRAEEIASKVPKLLMSAQEAARSIIVGEHPLKSPGMGHEFWQFRKYESHDRPQDIDWRKSAKTDSIFVRETEKHATQCLAIWVDNTAGMDWRGAKNHISKREACEVLALALGFVAIHNGEACRLYREKSPLAQNREMLEKLAYELVTNGLGKDKREGIKELGDVAMPSHSIPVLLSDFMVPVKDYEHYISGLSKYHKTGVVVQTLDPFELELPCEGRINFEIPFYEGRRQEALIENVSAIRDEYIERLEAHVKRISDITVQQGWSFYRYRSDQDPASLLQNIWMNLAANPAREFMS